MKLLQASPSKNPKNRSIIFRDPGNAPSYGRHVEAVSADEYRLETDTTKNWIRKDLSTLKEDFDGKLKLNLKEATQELRRSSDRLNKDLKSPEAVKNTFLTQRILHALGYNPGAIDGIYAGRATWADFSKVRKNPAARAHFVETKGSQTMKAVLKFQQDKGLRYQDGLFGPETKAALIKAADEKLEETASPTLTRRAHPTDPESVTAVAASAPSVVRPVPKPTPPPRVLAPEPEPTPPAPVEATETSESDFEESIEKLNSFDGIVVGEYASGTKYLSIDRSKFKIKFNQGEFNPFDTHNSRFDLDADETVTFNEDGSSFIISYPNGNTYTAAKRTSEEVAAAHEQRSLASTELSRITGETVDLKKGFTIGTQTFTPANNASFLSPRFVTSTHGIKTYISLNTEKLKNNQPNAITIYVEFSHYSNNPFPTQYFAKGDLNNENLSTLAKNIADQIEAGQVLAQKRATRMKSFVDEVFEPEQPTELSENYGLRTNYTIRFGGKNSNRTEFANADYGLSTTSGVEKLSWIAPNSEEATQIPGIRFRFPNGESNTHGIHINIHTLELSLMQNGFEGEELEALKKEFEALKKKAEPIRERLLAEEAPEETSPEGLMTEALSLANEGKHEEAFVLYVQAGNAGSKKGYLNAGYAYLNGTGKDIDNFSAAGYFEKAFDLGSGEAASELARLYEVGLISEVDVEKAHALYSQAIELGDTRQITSKGLSRTSEARTQLETAKSKASAQKLAGDAKVDPGLRRALRGTEPESEPDPAREPETGAEQAPAPETRPEEVLLGEAIQLSANINPKNIEALRTKLNTLKNKLARLSSGRPGNESEESGFISAANGAVTHIESQILAFAKAQDAEKRAKELKSEQEALEQGLPNLHSDIHNALTPEAVEAAVRGLREQRATFVASYDETSVPENVDRALGVAEEKIKELKVAPKLLVINRVAETLEDTEYSDDLKNTLLSNNVQRLEAAIEDFWLILGIDSTEAAARNHEEKITGAEVQLAKIKRWKAVKKFISETEENLLQDSLSTNGEFNQDLRDLFDQAIKDGKKLLEACAVGSPAKIKLEELLEKLENKKPKTATEKAALYVKRLREEA